MGLQSFLKRWMNIIFSFVRVNYTYGYIWFTRSIVGHWCSFIIGGEINRRHLYITYSIQYCQVLSIYWGKSVFYVYHWSRQYILCWGLQGHVREPRALAINYESLGNTIISYPDYVADVIDYFLSALLCGLGWMRRKTWLSCWFLKEPRIWWFH